VPWKVTLCCPVTVETDAGTVTRLPRADNPTLTLAASPEFIITWQLNGKPDCKVCGQASAVIFNPNSDKVVCPEDVPRFAISKAASSFWINVLVAVNGTEVLPATGWSKDGTVTWVLLDESRMPAPLDGAGPESAIWQLLVPAPIRVSGLHVMPVTVTLWFDGPSRVSFCETP